MKIPGVNGNVNAKGFENWINVDDIEFAGVTKTTKMIVGEGRDCFGGQPKFGQVSLLKSFDNSSCILFSAA